MVLTDNYSSNAFYFWFSIIESSSVWDTSCLAELVYDLINTQFLCGKCSKPVTIQYLRSFFFRSIIKEIVRVTDLSIFTLSRSLAIRLRTVQHDSKY